MAVSTARSGHALLTLGSLPARLTPAGRGRWRPLRGSGVDRGSGCFLCDYESLGRYLVHGQASGSQEHIPGHLHEKTQREQAEGQTQRGPESSGRLRFAAVARRGPPFHPHPTPPPVICQGAAAEQWPRPLPPSLTPPTPGLCMAPPAAPRATQLPAHAIILTKSIFRVTGRVAFSS